MSTANHLNGLIAEVSHGPGMHGALVLILVVIAVVGGLIYLVKSRRSSDRERD